MARKLAISILFGLSLLSAGCERVFGVKLSSPEAVRDLAAADIGLGSATLSWSQGSNGGSKPASYLLFVGNPSPSWPNDLTSATTVPGTSLGDTVRYTIADLQRATPYEAYVVSFRQDGDSVVFGSRSNLVAFTTEASDPNPVDDLSASSLGASTIQVRWTEVDDGAGRPASYLLAFGKQPVNWPVAKDSARRVGGNQIGAIKGVAVAGLEEGASYDFVVASVRAASGALVEAVSPFSAPASATTETIPVSGVAPFFQETFDTGSRTNANGFTWTSASTRVTVSTERPFSGSHSLRFKFGPDTTGGDSSAEQRFNLGRYLTEYWVDYMVFIPSNFTQRNDSPNNNKFYMTWRDTYSDATGGTWRIGYEYRGNADGTSTLRPMSSRWDLNSWTSSGLNHPQTGAPFIGGSGPVLKGQWNRIRMQFRAASSRSASDGVMRMWVNDQLYAELTVGRFHNFFDTPADAVLRNGYFMGWANSGFAEETFIYIDDVKFYDQNPGW